MAHKKRKNPTFRKSVSWTRAELEAWVRRVGGGPRVLKRMASNGGSFGRLDYDEKGTVIGVEGLLQCFPNALIVGLSAEGWEAFKGRSGNPRPRQATIHLKATRGGTFCGVEGQWDPDIVRVTCGRCLRLHEQAVGNDIDDPCRRPNVDDEGAGTPPTCGVPTAGDHRFCLLLQGHDGPHEPYDEEPSDLTPDGTSCGDCCKAGPAEAPWCSNGICPCHNGPKKRHACECPVDSDYGTGGSAFGPCVSCGGRRPNPAGRDSGYPEDDEFPEDAPTCPMCEGPGVVLGTLGRREHLRCRNCGMDFSRKV